MFVKASGTAAVHMSGVYNGGNLLGYSYERTELAKLGVGSMLPIFGETGWQVVKTDALVVGETIQVDGGRHLRLLDVGSGRAGLPAP